MAKPFARVLLELADADPRVCAVSCDCRGFIAPLAEQFPQRAIEIGIAEQNLIGIAAGLAVRGKIPFAIGMNPFVTMRCFEQVRTDLGYGARNVKVIGAYGGGVVYGGWGCTHHAIEEMALMRLIPTMTVVMPADAWETEQAVRAAAIREGPFYISLARGAAVVEQPEEARSFELGKAVLLREGDAATIIGVGPTVADALRAGDLLESQGIAARILEMHTVKPIDREAILRAAEETPVIVTIEEHTVIGGLGGAVAEVLAEAGAGTPLKRIGLQDVFAVMSGSQQDLKSRYGITAEAVVKEILHPSGAGAHHKDTKNTKLRGVP
ncbi:MAG: transketolase family protein [Chloroflexi bacterium]|nr:transketolase family protein [Chloroflexota bacterium]